MEYEWDENKNRVNYQKHGLSFEDAKDVFLGKTVTFLDDRIDYGEIRFKTLGELAGRVVIVVHPRRYKLTRIISMRKANAREKKIYQQPLEENR